MGWLEARERERAALHYVGPEHGANRMEWGVEIALGLAEMELIFPIAALTVLCFVLVARKMLLTHQCLGCCWAVLAQQQGCLSNIPPHSPSRLGVGKILGGDTARTADPNWPKGPSIPYDVCSAMKAKRKEEGWGAFVSTTLVFRSNRYAYWSPASREVAGHRLLRGSRE